jgi:UDP-GlcNAc:undecaprenyl-phosphate GlcNAc-1-phosphate transferase
MLLGFLLAASSISLTGQFDPSKLSDFGTNALAAYLPLLVPLAAVALPFLDLVMAYIRRTVAGKLWYQADKQHLHHRMLNLGHSHRRAVALLWLWSAVIAYGAVLIGLFPSLAGLSAWLLAMAIAALLTWGPRAITRVKQAHG